MTTLALGAPYRRLWSATLLSNLGDGVRAAAFPLLAASLTRDPIQISGVALATQLPGVLLALPAGSLADRFDRRRIVIAADAIRLAFLLGLIGLIASGWATMSVLYVVVFVSGATDVVRATAASTLVPSLVPLELLDRANGRLVTGRDRRQRVHRAASRRLPVRRRIGPAVRRQRRNAGDRGRSRGLHPRAPSDP